MTDEIKALERRLDELRSDIRRAAIAGDTVVARQRRAELRLVESEWEQALAALAEPAPVAQVVPAESLLPMREQVHHALTLLTVPAAPRLITAVHRAFFSGDLNATRLTSLRRDEERSFQSSQFARPYYLCPALTVDLLSPARGLLTVSTWPIADRIIGPLSPRVHFLTAAIRVAEAVDRLGEPIPEAARLLWRFAANIPGASDGASTPTVVADAARVELAVHAEADRIARKEAAVRADRLTSVQKLFGARLATVGTGAKTREASQ